MQGTRCSRGFFWFFFAVSIQPATLFDFKEWCGHHHQRDVLLGIDAVAICPEFYPVGRRLTSILINPSACASRSAVPIAPVFFACSRISFVQMLAHVASVQLTST